MKQFNTAGANKPDKHYCIPPLERINTEEILQLIDAERYFICTRRVRREKLRVCWRSLI